MSSSLFGGTSLAGPMGGAAETSQFKSPPNEVWRSSGRSHNSMGRRPRTPLATAAVACAIWPVLIASLASLLANHTAKAAVETIDHINAKTLAGGGGELTTGGLAKMSDWRHTTRSLELVNLHPKLLEDKFKSQHRRAKPNKSLEQIDRRDEQWGRAREFGERHSIERKQREITMRDLAAASRVDSTRKTQSSGEGAQQRDGATGGSYNSKVIQASGFVGPLSWPRGALSALATARQAGRQLRKCARVARRRRATFSTKAATATTATEANGQHHAADLVRRRPWRRATRLSSKPRNWKVGALSSSFSRHRAFNESIESIGLARWPRASRASAGLVRASGRAKRTINHHFARSRYSKSQQVLAVRNNAHERTIGLSDAQQWQANLRARTFLAPKESSSHSKQNGVQLNNNNSLGVNLEREFAYKRRVKRETPGAWPQVGAVFEDERANGELLELLADLYAHTHILSSQIEAAIRHAHETGQLRGVSTPSPLDGGQVKKVEHHEADNQGVTLEERQLRVRLKMLLNANEDGLMRWLSIKRERFDTLKNVTFELIQERPNRTINICPDGPKILIMPNITEVAYCYTHDQWIERLWSGLKFSAFHYPIILLNLLIFLVGTTGNIFVCLSVKRNHQLRSVTNYFIVNLAFADFLVILICLPATVVWDLSLTWFFDTIPCKLVMFLQDVSISVSVLTLTAISIDRYYAICHPLKFKSNLSQAKRIIALIWLVSLLIMTPDLVYLRAMPSEDLSEAGLETVLYSDCNYNWSTDASRAFQFVKTILLYLLPFVLMFCAHFRILQVLRLASSMMADCSAPTPAAAAAYYQAPQVAATPDTPTEPHPLAKTASSPPLIHLQHKPLLAVDQTSVDIEALSSALPVPVDKPIELVELILLDQNENELKFVKHHHRRRHHHAHSKGHERGRRQKCRCATAACRRRDEKGSLANGKTIAAITTASASLCELCEASTSGKCQACHSQTAESRSLPASGRNSLDSSSNGAQTSDLREDPKLIRQELEIKQSPPATNGQQQRVVASLKPQQMSGDSVEEPQQSSRQVHFQPTVASNCDNYRDESRKARGRSSNSNNLNNVNINKVTTPVPDENGDERRRSREYLRRQQMLEELLLEHDSFERPNDLLGQANNSCDINGRQRAAAADKRKRPATSSRLKLISSCLRHSTRFGRATTTCEVPLQLETRCAIESHELTNGRTNLTYLEEANSVAGSGQWPSGKRVNGHQTTAAVAIDTCASLASARGAPGPTLTTAAATSSKIPIPMTTFNADNTANVFILTMHNKSKLESRRKAAKMLTAIVVLFGICYLPVHLINFLRQFIEDIPQTDVTSTISMLAHCVCYLNSAINPIIYNHMNSVFRAEFRKFLSCLDWRQQPTSSPANPLKVGGQLGGLAGNNNANANGTPVQLDQAKSHRHGLSASRPSP